MKIIKYIIISIILIGIFSYFSFYYYQIYKENKKTIIELNQINKQQKEKIKNWEKEKINKLLEKKINLNDKKEINFANILETNVLILDQIRNAYLQNKQQEILESEQSKKIKNIDYELKIPSINLSVKTISLHNKGFDENKEQFFKDLDNELMKGVVRFPGKDILEDGVTLIYGHSSQNMWIRKNISFFRKLPIVNIGEKIIVDGYEYEIIESKEINTNEISDYQRYYDNLGITNKDKYIMLITCYPINTTEKRWIVIAKKK